MATNQDNKKEDVNRKKTCGIIMPIAPHPEYPSEHWKDVLDIMNEAIRRTEFEPKLVSDDEAIGLIHDRIVTNVYNNEIVVCDVSSKNPNVMFELGLRLAFDKPIIIIKDERTEYSFDTGGIEHISYPSTLNFPQIVKFQDEVTKKINATYKKSQTESNYSPFLKSFGKTIKPASIKQTEIPEGKYILDQLDALRQEIHIMRVEQRNNSESRYQNKIFSEAFTDTYKKNIISSIIMRYLNKNSSTDVLTNEEVFSKLKYELQLNGIEISNNELKNILCKFIDREKIGMK
ncbi:MAG: hypothetical protein LLG13_12630 [Bacteroidales bacterium]|nr:hypothetical protein [Bacteroidales bacterium]